MVGKTGSVDQKADVRFERVRLQVLAQRGLFARQGTVVAGWRTYRNRRLGPYFRLAYREGGRQRSIYLGRCAELAWRVGELLAGLQRRLKDRRLFARLKAQVRASLRLAKAELARLLAPWGIRLDGLQFRGAVREGMRGYVSGQWSVASGEASKVGDQGTGFQGERSSGRCGGGSCGRGEAQRGKGGFRDQCIGDA